MSNTKRLERRLEKLRQEERKVLLAMAAQRKPPCPTLKEFKNSVVHLTVDMVVVHGD